MYVDIDQVTESSDIDGSQKRLHHVAYKGGDSGKTCQFCLFAMTKQGWQEQILSESNTCFEISRDHVTVKTNREGLASDL